MRQVMVRYKVKPELAQENERLVRAVYDELEHSAPAGLRYTTFKLEDGVSFVHLASIHLVIEEGRTSAQAGALLRGLTQERPEFPPLRRNGAGAIDLRHAWEASDLVDYERRVREWAEAVWASYEPSHELIRRATSQVYQA